MILKQLTVKQSLNKAYRLIKPDRADIEKFKANLKLLLGHINPQESEENMKGHVMDFLKNTYYSPTFHIATKGRTDFVIHTGKNATHPAGVLFEAKKPSNYEMVTTTDLNRKAMHELILYYLRERIEHHNNDIRYLVITNIYEWFVFNAPEFERLFFKNSTLIKEYKAWVAKQKVSTNNDLFYNEIAKPFITSLTDEIQFTWFDIREFEKPLLDSDKDNDNKLIPLFKILSPTHLLKLSFANDSNTLDRGFYNELLYLIGLEEVKEGSKKLIRRKQQGKRSDGSLLENTIVQLDTENCIHKVSDRQSYGDTTEDQLFSVALELCITWVNRILFLKLLEAQLLKYHKGNKDYRFLNYNIIPQYDELYKLFFQVLARKQQERIERVRVKYKHVPYLNSSLFEITALEEQTIRINMLDDTAEMPLLNSTVLTNDRNKPIAPKLNTLQYIFEFLNAYDFASEGSEEIQEERKPLINASVLGLIFEKINGYKDGSIFTPGFITMYMCRQSIRQAVVNKFKEKYTWKAETFEDLHNYLSDDRTAKTIKDYNALINSLTICDPAVGSGHFLVSALNELIAIKSELGILADVNGKRLTDHTATIENDELLITDRERNFFTYYVATNHEHITIPNSEIQRVQETLFHEKQSIIENCLFGVDINPKSVQICRLRLWIELLKNAYYIAEGSNSNGELQTLPNIDINIKTGNSLISRFGLDEDLKAATPYFEKKILEYKSWVTDYKHEVDKDKKRGIQQLMTDLKKGFLSKVTDRNPTKIKVDKLSKEFLSKYVSEKLFSQNLTDAQKKDKERLDKEIEKLNKELEAYIKSPVYHNAFEWRFEFPEVLDNEGNFIGFDVIIGNPPYIRQEELGTLKELLAKTYSVYSGTADLLVYFFEKGISILKDKGLLSLISSNKFIRANYGVNLRSYLWNYNIRQIIDFGELPVFDEAATFPVILSISKEANLKQVEFTQVPSLKSIVIEDTIREHSKILSETSFQGQSWSLGDNNNAALLDKLKSNSVRLTDYVGKEIYRGVLTGFNEAFIIDDIKKEELIKQDEKSEELIHKIIVGDDIRKYELRDKQRYIILTKVGINIENYPAIFSHLKKYQVQLEKRWDKGNHWWELRPCKYYNKFLLPKIHIPAFALESRFCLDKGEYVSLNPAYFIPKDDKYLLGLLNSKVIWYFLRKVTPVLGDENKRGRLVIRTVYFENIPIKNITSPVTALIEKLVTEILYMKEKKQKTDTFQLERQIDELVYQLYNLTPEEIQLVEHSFQKKEAIN